MNEDTSEAIWFPLIIVAIGIAIFLILAGVALCQWAGYGS